MIKIACAVWLVRKGGVWLNPLDWLFPPKCPICGEILRKKERRICHNCRKSMPRVVEPCCSRCGKPVTSETQEYCFDCRKKRQYPAADPICQGTALWEYTDAMKRAMADFKYEGCQEDGILFGEEFVRFREGKIREWEPDYVIPVPLHRKKKWFRGFNQAACVAGRMGELIGLPVLPKAIERVRYTIPQKGLNDKERQNNMKGAFRLCQDWRERLQGKRILLVDDIYTTGATLEACAEELLEHGTGDIFFACLCIGRDQQ